MAVTLFDDLRSKVGVGFYHPNQKEVAFMADLQGCLSKELGFKQITQEMLTPPLIIDTFHERPFYLEWVIGLTSVFFGLVFIGCIIELHNYLCARRRRKRKAAQTVENQQTIQMDTK